MTESFSSCLQKQENIKKFFLNGLAPEALYQKLIELGRTLPPFPEEKKTQENRVIGCQSQVFLDARLENGKVFFLATSDALISAGLVALLLSIYDGEPPETILGCPPHMLEELGLHRALTPGRSHGLSSIHLRMKQEAVKFLTLRF